jgi:hypothetical protein
MITRTHTVSRHSVNNKFTQKFGGYLLYWKLYTQLCKNLRALRIHNHVVVTTQRMTDPYKLQIGQDVPTTWHLMNLYTIQFIWFCLIKPLGQFYSRVTTMRGDFVVTNGHFQNTNLKKCRTHYIFGIPVFYQYDMTLTDENIKDLTK